MHCYVTYICDFHFMKSLLLSFSLLIFLSLILPSRISAAFIKNANNPVLDIDPSQNWEANSVDGPVLIYEDNLFKMWYGGNNSGHSHIGYAEGTDGKTFSRYSHNPLIPASTINSSDIGVEHPSILKLGNEYYMWFTRIANNPLNFDLYYSTSNNGLNWNTSTHLEFDISTSWDSQHKGAQEVIYDSDSQIYKLWYTALGLFNGSTRWRIGYATSTNGINWNKHFIPVLQAEAGWEGADVGNVSVLYENGIYHMWYHAQTGIGHATSTDGINWIKNSDNPILTPSPSSFDSKRVLNPYVLKKDNVYYLYYAGVGNDDKWRIGLAISDSLPAPITTPTPTSSPSPTPTITPTPPGPDTSPIVLVVELGASWNGQDFASCRLTSSHQWKLTPHFATYNRLIKTLKKRAKLKEDQDFYVYTYDWRQTLDNQSGLFRTFLQKQLQNKPQSTKFRIISHSFGGLILRSYLENYPHDHHIGQVLTIGTPHEGSSVVYPLWAAGDVSFVEQPLRFIYSLFINRCRNLYGYGVQSARLSIQNTIPSLQHMLPMYPYISSNSTLTPVENMYNRNNWLPDHPFPEDTFGIPFSTVSGADKKTIRSFIVVPPTAKQQSDGDWLDGKPRDNTISLLGDNTVLQLSSKVEYPSVKNYILPDDHQSLLYSDAGIKLILKYLGLTQVEPEIAEIVPETTSQRMLGITTDLPATMELMDKKRRRIRSDDQLLIAYDPQKDTYILLITPDQSGVYNFQITITNTSGETQSTEVTQTMTKRKTKRFFLKYDPASSAPPVLTPQ